MYRVLVSLVALLGVTAFAPAPFPKPSRGRASDDTITAQSLQGTWRVASMMRSSKNGNHAPHRWQVTHVRIKDDNWAFLTNGSVGGTHTFAIDDTKKPAHLDFNRGAGGGLKVGRTAGQGIIRRKGQAVEIIYVFGGNNRPVSFEQPPDGQYVLTLQRQ